MEIVLRDMTFGDVAPCGGVFVAAFTGPPWNEDWIGSALLLAAQHELLQRGVASIEIGTDKNTPAEAFYRKHGFKETAATKTEIYMSWQFN